MRIIAEQTWTYLLSMMGDMYAGIMDMLPANPDADHDHAGKPGEM